MIPAIIILGVSFLAMVTMLVARLHEVKVGRQVIAIPARVWCDKHVHRARHTVREIAHVAATKKFWTCLAAYSWNVFVDKIWHHPHVEKVTKKAVDVVRGKKEIKSNGPVSFYLKDVAEYKKQVRSL